MRCRRNQQNRSAGAGSLGLGRLPGAEPLDAASDRTLFFVIGTRPGRPIFAGPTGPTRSAWAARSAGSARSAWASRWAGLTDFLQLFRGEDFFQLAFHIRFKILDGCGLFFAEIQLLNHMGR